jgi:transposase
MQITTIGLDIAKNVFQVHGIDAAEKVVVRKQLRRGQVIAFFKALAPCLIGMEACATAHYWARELTKLGHQVRLMPAKDVKAYVKRNKNDAADAEAICEAVRRPTMRFVAVKSAEQQARLMQHRVRDLLMRQRTQLINALRAHLAELGIAAAQGREGIKELLTIVAQDRFSGAASGCADDDRIDRETDCFAASFERGEQAAQDDPRHRDYRGHHDRSGRPGSEGFSIGP